MTSREVAFFDVDGTLLRGNIVSYYARLRLLGMSPIQQRLWTAAFLAKVPYYLLLDKVSRRRFATTFYRNYRGMSPAEMRKRVSVLFKEFIEPYIYPDAEKTVKEHLSTGRRVVFVTGSLEPIVELVAQRLEASEVICCRLEERGGEFTGELEEGPLTDAEKATAVRRYAEERKLDLSLCYSYADSMDDIPMLEQTGRPHVVNPKGRLARVAAERGWPILHWELSRQRPGWSPSELETPPKDA